ncbi:MAG: prenyltransferase, partial [Candidatus Dormibacteria bacterium]
VQGGISEREALGLAYFLFALTIALGLYLVAVRGPFMLALGLLGVLGGYFYTAPPFQYKYRALGIPLVFLLMGVLMTVGGYFAATGTFDWRIVVFAVPAGLLVTAILHGNEWRDIAEDTRLGFSTYSGRAGKTAAYRAYAGLVIGAYLALAVGVMVGVLPTLSLLAMLSLPAGWVLLRSAERASIGSIGEINMIDLRTARLHATFGVLLVLGILLTRTLP